MNKNIIAVMFMFALAGVQAQETNDPKAGKILKEVSEKAKTYNTIVASFTITQEDKKAGETSVQKGSVKVKGEKYVLKLDDYEVYNDGKITWTFDSDMNEATRDLTEDVRDPDSPTFSEMLTMWEDGYKYKFESEATRNGKTYQVIDLYPEHGNDKPYHTARITIDKDKKEIVKIILLGKDGINYIYDIQTFEVNVSLPDDTFIFDPSKHPDVEVIDNVM